MKAECEEEEEEHLRSTVHNTTATRRRGETPQQ